MKKLLSTPLLMMFLLVFANGFAQAPKFSGPQEYNDYIVLQQTTFAERLMDFNQAMGDPEVSVETVKIMHGELLDVARTSADNVKAMKSFQKNTRLRDAAYGLYSFYVDMIDHEYRELMLIALMPEASEADLARMDELVAIVTEKEKRYDEEFQAAQQEFARIHNMELSRPVEEFEGE